MFSPKEIFAFILSLSSVGFSSYAMEQENQHLDRLRRLAESHNVNHRAEAIRSFQAKEPQVTLNDIVGGMPDEITRLIEVVKHSDRYSHLDIADQLHMVLLEGPPGTGKSMLAEAIAHELGREFYHVKSSSFITSFQGSGAEATRLLFQQVKDKGTPAVIFIDEID
jgi:ATP-dependent 26S proteasome regulatory subunit